MAETRFRPLPPRRDATLLAPFRADFAVDFRPEPRPDFRVDFRADERMPRFLAMPRLRAIRRTNKLYDRTRPAASGKPPQHLLASGHHQHRRPYGEALEPCLPNEEFLYGCPGVCRFARSEVAGV